MHFYYFLLNFCSIYVRVVIHPISFFSLIFMKFPNIMYNTIIDIFEFLDVLIFRYTSHFYFQKTKNVIGNFLQNVEIHTLKISGFWRVLEKIKY